MKIVFLFFCILTTFNSRAEDMIEISHVVQNGETIEEIIGYYVKPNLVIDKNSPTVKDFNNKYKGETNLRVGQEIILFFLQNEIKSKFIPKHKLIKDKKYYRYRIGIGSTINQINLKRDSSSATLSYYDNLVLSYSGYDYFKRVNIYTSLELSPFKSKINSNVRSNNDVNFNGGLKIGTYLTYKKTIPLLYLFYDRKTNYNIFNNNNITINTEGAAGIGLGFTQYFFILNRDLTVSFFYDKSLYINNDFSRIGTNAEILLFKNYGTSLSFSKLFSDNKDIIKYNKISATLSYFF